MENQTQFATICGLQITWYMGKAELVLEEYEEAEAATGMAPVIRAVELGEFSKEELDRFHHALSLKADGHKGPITAEFIQELQDIIKNSL